MKRGQKFVNAPALVALMLVMGMMLAAMPVRAEETMAGTFLVVQEGRAYYADIVTANGQVLVSNVHSIPVELLKQGVNEGCVYAVSENGLDVKMMEIKFGFAKIFPVIGPIQYPDDDDPDTPEYFITVWYGVYWVKAGSTSGRAYGYYIEAYGTLVNG